MLKLFTLLSRLLRIANRPAILISLILVPSQLVACALCIGFPEKTVADFLLEGHCALLAQNSARNAFSYTPTKVLTGRYDNSEIELLVDSGTRRVLSNFPGNHVLLVQKKRGGKWQSLGIVNDEYLDVLQRIVALKAHWAGRDGERNRWQFFVQLFNHSNPKIRQLAYLEVGRAPYSVIRQLGKTAPRETYEKFLNDPKYLKWKSLAILLVAQSDKKADRQYVLDSFHSAQRLGLSSNLAAWAAAAIEVQGTETVDFIEENYFRQKGAPIEDIRAVSSALAILGSQSDSALQDRIVASFQRLICVYPSVASDIADDLLSWKRFELAKEMSMILAEHSSLSYDARQKIRQYVRAKGNLETSHD